MTAPIIWTRGVTLEALEKQVILRAFDELHGNKTATASALGIAIRTLEAKLSKYDQQQSVSVDREAEAADRNRDFLLRCRGQHPDQLSPPRPVAVSK